MLYARKIVGHFGRERMHVKGFKIEAARQAFIRKDERCLVNPQGWETYNVDGAIKAGIYARVNGNWRNVKDIDSLLLAHI